jgi:phosphohistidine swiveling domain-containing protein
VTATPAAVVGLDEPAALDTAVAGAKARGLARARAAGFPVLDGFVIPTAASIGPLAAGRARLASAGTGGARMAVIRSEPDDGLRAEVARAADRLPEPLIVRSSSVLEGRGEWSGAFTSVPEVRRHEILKAARSVWATCFAPDVLDRFEAAGMEAGRVPMALLVQPEVAPDVGGTASVDANGAVTVDAVKGSPRDLMAGWVPGVRAVDEDGVLVGGEAVDLMGEACLGQVVDLTRRVRAVLGSNLIEWAVHDGRVVLFQVQDSVRAAAPAPVAIPAALGHPFARELAVMAHRHPGPLGEDLVLGWLPGSFRHLDTSPPPGVPATDQEARELAAQLTAQAWGEPAAQALAHARLVLRRLRSDRPDEAIETLRDLRPVDPEAAARLLGMVEHRVRAEAAAGRRGRDRWEPLLAGVAALQGEAYDGLASVGGTGAGRLVWVESPTRTDHVRPRDIVVAQYPLPNFSPLLWDAAGVVTVGGAASAHLFEVARSLTVPAVVDCPVAAVVRDGPVLGMVDGDSGRVAVLR